MVFWGSARSWATNSGHSGSAFGSSHQDRTVLLKEKKNQARRKVLEARTEASRKTWARAYGSEGYDVANCVHQTRDGGYIIAGFGFFGMDVWLIKLSPEGKIEWQRAYGGDGPDWASSIQETPDGGFIVAGYTTSPGYPGSWDRDYLVLKLDPRGNVEWQRAYGDISTDDWATSVGQTDDGGYVVAGISQPLDGGNSDYWILRLRASGDIEWQHKYGGPNDDDAESIVATADGGFIVAGYSWSFEGDYSDIWLLKLAGNGNIEWQRVYGEIGTEWTTGIQQTMDGGYIVAGYSSSFHPERGEAWIMKLFSSGDIQWQRLYRRGGGGAHSVKQTREGDYIVAGFADYPDEAGGEDAWVLRLDAAGEVEWQRTYGASPSDRAYAIEQTDDGGFIASGETSSHLGQGGADFLILKIDRDGLIERVPEIMRTSEAEALETFVFPRPTSVVQQVTNLTPRLTDLISQNTNVPDSLLFSPPLNFSGEMVTNRSLSQREYMHVLKWEANPNNDDLRVTKYRIYNLLVGKQLLAEVDARTFRYEVRNVWPGIRYTYAVVGVTSDNEEGLPAILTLEQTGKLQ
jgi:hypothetical protein